MDLPLAMESDIVENEDGPGPYGSKGMSEGALLPVAPAVAAAVRDATGVVDPGPAAHAGAGLAGARRRHRRRCRPDDAAAAPMSRTFALDQLPDLPIAEARALVGGKAANLGVMARELGLPVPPGFVITTDDLPDVPGRAAGRPASTTSSGPGWREVEAKVGRRFGDPSDPLLVSVRSGAPVSMPGMMDTILNLGLNDATTDGSGRGTGDDAFARSCRERLDASFPVDRRRRRPGGPLAAAAPGDRGRLPLLEQRPGQRLSAEGGHPRRPRDRR